MVSIQFKKFGKKGIVFSIISVLIVISFGLMVSFMVAETKNQADDSFVYKAEALNQYYSLLKTHYLPRVVAVTSRIAMEKIILYEVTNNTFVDKGNLTLVYQNIVSDGVHESPSLPIDYSLNQTRTLNYWTNFFEEQAIVLFNLKTPDVPDPIQITPLYSLFSLEQTTPWQVTVKTYFNISVDATDFKISDETYEIETQFSILDLEDPLYGAHTEILYPINFSNYTKKVNEWDQAELESALTKYSYFPNIRAPCFLMRLQNMTGSTESYDDCSIESGIESFIHPKDLRFAGSPFESYNSTADTRSYVDHLFFNDSYELCYLNNDPAFYLYGIDEISNTSENKGFRLDLFSLTQYLGTDFYDSNTSVVCGNGRVS